MRSRGEADETGRYTRHGTKLKIFSLPNYEQVAEWQSSKDACQNSDSFRNIMMEDNTGNVVALCFGPASNTQPFAIGLSIPALEVSHKRVAADHEKGAPIGILLERLGVIYTPARNPGGNGFILRDTANLDGNIRLDDPQHVERAGALTFQGFFTVARQRDKIGLKYCGGTDMVTNPPEINTAAAWGPSFCRTLKYNWADGSYEGYLDSPETRFSRPPSHPKEFSIQLDHWDLIGIVDRASKAGQLIVRDAESGNTLQTIESKTQTPITVSPDGKFLFTYRPNKREIAIYEISERQ